MLNKSKLSCSRGIEARAEHYPPSHLPTLICSSLAGPKGSPTAPQLCWSIPCMCPVFIFSRSFVECPLSPLFWKLQWYALVIMVFIHYPSFQQALLRRNVMSFISGEFSWIVLLLISSPPMICVWNLLSWSSNILSTFISLSSAWLFRGLPQLYFLTLLLSF